MYGQLEERLESISDMARECLQLVPALPDDVAETSKDVRIMFTAILDRALQIRTDLAKLRQISDNRGEYGN